MSTRIEDVAVEPRTVDEARDAVERSRQRISSTLDALEGRIVDKKHEIQDRVDVLKPVREQIGQRPFTAVAVAVGVGALLGSMGGGDSDDDRKERSPRRDSGKRLGGDDRSDLREWRRMRRERLQARSRHERDDSDPSRFDALKHQLAGAVTSAIGAVVTAKVREFTGVTKHGDRR